MNSPPSPFLQLSFSADQHHLSVSSCVTSSSNKSLHFNSTIPIFFNSCHHFLLQKAAKSFYQFFKQLYYLWPHGHHHHIIIHPPSLPFFFAITASWLIKLHNNFLPKINLLSATYPTHTTLANTVKASRERYYYTRTTSTDFFTIIITLLSL